MNEKIRSLNVDIMSTLVNCYKMAIENGDKKESNEVETLFVKLSNILTFNYTKAERLEKLERLMSDVNLQWNILFDTYNIRI